VAVAYELCATVPVLNVSFAVFWNRRRGDQLDVAVQAGVSVGWAGIGFSTIYGKMLGPAVVAAHEYAAPETYALSASPRAVRNDSVLVLSQKSVTKEPAAGLLTFTFTATGMTEDAPNIIFGYGLVNPSTGLLVRHIGRGAGCGGELAVLFFFLFVFVCFYFLARLDLSFDGIVCV
jgi:hypothetical protein